MGGGAGAFVTGGPIGAFDSGLPAPWIITGLNAGSGSSLRSCSVGLVRGSERRSNTRLLARFNCSSFGGPTLMGTGLLMTTPSSPSALVLRVFRSGLMRDARLAFPRSLDARKEEEVVSFLRDADTHAPLEVCIFNIGANVNFPLLDTTERVFRKVWEMACYSGFLAGREAARRMLPHGRGSIFFTGATASLRGGVGYAAFASAKFGLRAVAQAAARELWPKNIHVAHLIIDAGVDTAWVRERIRGREGQAALDDLNPDRLMPPASVAEAYWQIYQQPRSAWVFEQEIRPFGEKW